MLTIKNAREGSLFFFLALAFLLPGCTPPGPRALLEGKRLIDEGNYRAAIEELRVATSSLSSNGQAWNYLGVACQHAGQFTNALQAYQRALTLDRDLAEPHYNLGCLWLDQNQLASASAEFNAYTLRRGQSAEGWLKLGTTQLRMAGIVAASGRARMLDAAEKNLGQALRLDPRNPEIPNALGLVQVQRGLAREGARYFVAALKLRREYAPALLNLAVVAQLHLSQPQYALQKYREYLALPQRQPEWEAVNAVARELERQLAPNSARQTPVTSVRR